MLHRAVMTMVLGPLLGRDEFVCHRDDDAGNNWPENLYLGIGRATRPTACGMAGLCGDITIRTLETWMLRFARYGEPRRVESGRWTSPRPRCAPEHDQQDQAPGAAQIVLTEPSIVTDSGSERDRPSTSLICVSRQSDNLMVNKEIIQRG